MPRRTCLAVSSVKAVYHCAICVTRQTVGNLSEVLGMRDLQSAPGFCQRLERLTWCRATEIDLTQMGLHLTPACVRQWPFPF